MGKYFHSEYEICILPISFSFSFLINIDIVRSVIDDLGPNRDTPLTSAVMANYHLTFETSISSLVLSSSMSSDLEPK